MKCLSSLNNLPGSTCFGRISILVLLSLKVGGKLNGRLGTLSGIENLLPEHVGNPHIDS